MRRILGPANASIAIALGVLACSCNSAPRLDRGLTHALRTRPGEEPVRILVRDRRVVAVTVPIPEERMPAAVRRAADAMVPDGRSIYRGQVWELGSAVRFVVEKTYDTAAGRDHRSALINIDGTVLEHGHRIRFDDAPKAVRDALASARDAGMLDHVSSMSGTGSLDWYRALVTLPEGGRKIVDLQPDGGIRSEQTVRHAEIAVAR